MNVREEETKYYKKKAKSLGIESREEVNEVIREKEKEAGFKLEEVIYELKKLREIRGEISELDEGKNLW